MQANHPWKLVSPWYRVDSVGGVNGNRNAAPIFQKYAATDFANRLVREPQESLKFTSEDFVNRVTFDPDQVVTPAMRQDNRQPIKLFLDLHSRFYTVVAELHCDLPGFPNVKRDEVCEAGFVIRRRVPVVPQEAAAKVAKNRAENRRIKAQLLKAGGPGTNSGKAPQTLSDLIRAKTGEIKDSFRRNRIDKLKATLEANEAELKKLKAEYGLTLRLEGWVPGAEKGVGNWRPVEETPEALEEAVLPMYPLIDDPTDPTHSSRGRSQWFGVVPTGSSDTDAQTKPRFEDNVLYEIRCFVRRHVPQCPKKTNETDCSGELVWSAPTESYQIASAFDLDGGSHRPISIKMPDLGALREQAALGPAGRGVNTRVITPPDSGLGVVAASDLGMPTQDSGPQHEFCFYFFLIFFIVAFFLFQLFLPILMFVLQLWFLLTLKLCIPPSIGLDAGLAAELKLEGDIGVALDAGFEFGGEVYFAGDIVDNLVGAVNADDTLKADFGDRLKNDSTWSSEDIGNLFVNMATDFSDDPEYPQLSADLPTIERGLVYFDKVTSP